MRDTRMRVPEKRELLDMACRCCGEYKVRLVLDLGDQPQANRLVKPDLPIGAEPVYPLRLGWCETCTMLQIDHTVPRDDMFREYVYVSGTTETLLRHFAETTQRLIATYGVKAGDLVVDIGSNDGTWLETWPRNVRCVGVEPSEAGLLASAKSIITIPDYFGKNLAVSLRDGGFGSAKIITSNGSFFHMEDLHGACEGVRELLADDGVFVCGAIYAHDMIMGNAFDQVLHEHLLYYSVKSFDHLMRLHGMYVFNVVHHPIHGGTMEYHVAKNNRLWNGSVVDRAKQEERELDHYEMLHAFAKRILVLRDELVATLERYHAAGKKVWAYGAPGKGGTLLNSFGISEHLVLLATEKNSRKWGLEIPGCRIPIYAESGLKPDAFLVLAWNFLAEFMEKEKDWLAAGGEFIVPVPNVRVLP